MSTDSKKKVLVLLAPGFEEIETVTPVDILRRSGARVVLAGLSEGPIEGSRGVFFLSDCTLGEVDINEYDLVILPGGLNGTINLQNDERVLRLLKSMNSRGKLIAAICAAPTVLQSAGILDNRSFTSHPSVKHKFNKVNYSEDRVMVDGNLITSRSPGTALEFALKLVEILFGQKRMETINKGVLAMV